MNENQNKSVQREKNKQKLKKNRENLRASNC